MYIKHTIHFSLKTSRTNADNRPGKRDYPLRMRVTYNALRVDIPLHVSIFKDSWNSKRELPIDSVATINGNTEEKPVNTHGATASDINAILSEYRLYTHNVFKAFEVENVVPSADVLKKAISASMASGKIDISAKKILKVSLAEAFDLFKVENGAKNSWTTSTYEKFNALWVDLVEFKKNIGFKDLDEGGLTSFVSFLRDEKLVREERKGEDGKVIQEAVRGLKNSTIGKKMGFLTWFLNWATRKGYNNILDYQTFKPKLKTTQTVVVFLTQAEIQQLCDYVIPENKKYLERIRDVFVFCCFTGLRYSDARNLKKGDIKSDFFDVTTVKTADSLRIEFNTISRAILDKYRDLHLADDKALPTISNQKMNDELKELCMLAGINTEIRKTYYRGNERIDERGPKYEFVSTHTGRKSFICNALALGIPVNVVMKWTGHADYKSMKPYIAVADEIKMQEMAKFNLSDIHIK